MQSKLLQGVCSLLATVGLLTMGSLRANAWTNANTYKTYGRINSLTTGILYEQPVNPDGQLLLSAWLDPDGSNFDEYVWDNFTLPSGGTITEINWYGVYDPLKFGNGGPVLDFTVSIYPSIPAGTEPAVAAPPLVEYQTAGNAGETAIGTVGGTPLYAYAFSLPVSFNASAGVKYWVQIEAFQHGTVPDWCLVAGSGGNGSHYWKGRGAGGDVMYRALPGDAAFTLLGSIPYFLLTVSKSGTGNGTVTSDLAGINCGLDCSEAYPYNTIVTLTAAPAAGSTFNGWSGDADCLDGQVTLNAPRTCSATFTDPSFTQGASITIGTLFIGNYPVLSNPSTIISQPNLVDGPVRVTSAKGTALFTSERVISGDSFNEVMGYPTNQLTTEYWFPWYDNVTMGTWLLVGNASSTQAAGVDIYIGGVRKGSYTIPIGGRVTPRFNIPAAGPVRVVSTNGAKIFTSERTLYGLNNSFNEVMGYPANQFTTEYWFPWYDNKDMSTWILVGNPSTTATANVDIYIGGTKSGSYSIPRGGNVTPRFGATQAGPVRVVSTNRVKIFTSERTVTLTGDSFNEVMGYPASQFTTEFWYPWYDNVGMMTWVLVGNPTGGTAKVDIYVGGVKRTSTTIPAGGRIMPRYTGLHTGPVRVVSTNGVKIFTSQRVLYGSSFNEVMGYPGNKLTTEYWFPWYDSTSMSTDILVGMP